MTDAISNPIGSHSHSHSHSHSPIPIATPSIPTATPIIPSLPSSKSLPSTIPSTNFSTHLASALSTVSDAQYFQDSISPATVRAQLTSRNLDPTDVGSSAVLIRSLKWLLAGMSKGRDVSDFFPHVVKLVAAPSMEVRKMVYMYTVHYADHNDECRDLALLSINSFQRGLTDPEQYIRALALRVLTSIHVKDVVQIQILAVRTCSNDRSPYVRKCAANAIGKLYPRVVGSGGSGVLVDLWKEMLDRETSTMVVSSIMMSFAEVCPDRLELLHGSFRKLCHLLTDMDEWGQIVVMDVLTRYCRTFFRNPDGENGTGSAEKIDMKRRVVRRITDAGVSLVGVRDDVASALPWGTDTTVLTNTVNNNATTSAPIKKKVVKNAFYSSDEDVSSDEDHASHTHSPSNINSTFRQRNVLGFDHTNPNSNSLIPALVTSANRQPPSGSDDVTNLYDSPKDGDSTLAPDHGLLLRSSLPLLKSRNSGVVMAVCSLQYYCGKASIAIRSALGKALVRIYRDRREIQYVVLCSVRMLVWECPSAFTPYLHDFFVKAMDPSFTRLIKLDILTALALEPKSIDAVLKELRTYIRHDDKNFVCASIQAVGKIVELARIVYDRLDDSGSGGRREEANIVALNCVYGLLGVMESSEYGVVVGECVEVVQKVLTMLRSDTADSVEDPNRIQKLALRKLILVLARSLESLERNGCEVDPEIMEREDDGDEEGNVLDDNLKSLCREIVLLPMEKVAPALWFVGEWLSNNGTTTITTKKKGKSKKNRTRVEGTSFDPDDTIERRAMGLELLRLIGKSFPDMDPILKSHSVHFASKLLLSTHPPLSLANSDSNLTPLCEYILGMGRIDTDPDVRDRARYESHLLRVAVGLQHDVEHMVPPPEGADITPQDARDALLRYNRPSSSWLPIEREIVKGGDGGVSVNAFRFGTLSSMVSHRVGGDSSSGSGNGVACAGNSYLHLPPWAEQDSPTSLRDPPQTDVLPTTTKRKNKANEQNEQKEKGWVSNHTSFYDTDDSDEDSSSSSHDDEEDSDDTTTSDNYSTDSGSSSSSDSSKEDSEEESSSDEEQDTSSDDDDKTSNEEDDDMVKGNSNLLMFGSPPPLLPATTPIKNTKRGPNHEKILVESASDDNSSSFSSSSSSSSSSYIEDNKPSHVKVTESLLDIPTSTQSNNLLGNPSPDETVSSTSPTKPEPTGGAAGAAASLVSGLEGLVMSPLASSPLSAADERGGDDLEKESGMWNVLVRHELSGGLALDARFLRGSAKEKEAKKLGISFGMNGGANVVCIQIRIENKRSDRRVLRRIKIYSKSATSSYTRRGGSAIPVTRVVLPDEIELLAHSCVSHTILALEFATPSDKDGAIQAKFDVKSDRGTTEMVICPPLGEMLLSSNSAGSGGIMKSGEFDAALDRLQGIHQRCAASFSLMLDGTSGSGSKGIKNKMNDALMKIGKAANLTPINKKLAWNSHGHCKLVGRLPASGSQVLVSVKCNSNTGVGEIVVCCDYSMALNTILDLLKCSVAT